ncbi:hypothetical protein L6V77_18145 [Myxococcota bacterium]|nr:hypothetical protein [Myxococcota bacterium]
MNRELVALRGAPRAARRFFRLVTAAGLVSCGEASSPVNGPGGGQDGAPPEPPSCPATARLIAFDAEEADASHPLAAGDRLAVIEGFQGFVFVQVGLSTTDRLGATVTGHTELRLASGERLTETYGGLSMVSDAGAFRTDKLLVYFNDQPPATLYGRQAEVMVVIDGDTCRATARASVVLGPAPSPVAADAGR